MLFQAVVIFFPISIFFKISSKRLKVHSLRSHFKSLSVFMRKNTNLDLQCDLKYPFCEPVDARPAIVFCFCEFLDYIALYGHEQTNNMDL